MQKATSFGLKLKCEKIHIAKYAHLKFERETDHLDQVCMNQYQPQKDVFISLVHGALKIRGDLIAKPGHREI